jgi:hypothetical protein
MTAPFSLDREYAAGTYEYVVDVPGPQHQVVDDSPPARTQLPKFLRRPLLGKFSHRYATGPSHERYLMRQNANDGRG